MNNVLITITFLCGFFGLYCLVSYLYSIYQSMRLKPRISRQIYTINELRNIRANTIDSLNSNSIIGETTLNIRSLNIGIDVESNNTTKLEVPQ